MDLVMACRSIVARQVHREPVFLASLRVEVKPREVLGFLGKFANIHGDLCIVTGQGGPQTTGAGVRKQRQIFSGLQSQLTGNGWNVYDAEFHEVISATGRTDLSPRFVFQALYHRDVAELITLEDGVIFWAFKSGLPEH